VQRMEIGVAEFAVGAAAVWRLTHLLNAEDGPWNMLTRMRKRAGNGALGKMLDCFYCLSVWVALPVAAALGTTWKERILLWPALSGAAILLERAAARAQHGAGQAMWYEEPERQISKGAEI
jgi:hypothetical protein